MRRVIKRQGVTQAMRSQEAGRKRASAVHGRRSASAGRSRQPAVNNRRAAAKSRAPARPNKPPAAVATVANSASTLRSSAAPDSPAAAAPSASAAPGENAATPGPRGHADVERGTCQRADASRLPRTLARCSGAIKCECLDFVNAAALPSAPPATDSSTPMALQGLALFDAEECADPTAFYMSESEVVAEMVQQLRCECPQLMTSRAAFMCVLGEQYDKMLCTC